MTKHSGKHYASVTHAVSLWLCRAAVNNGHKYCNQVNVYLTPMLFVIMHKESCIKRVDPCKVTSHMHAKHRLGAAMSVQPGKGLPGISHHCCTHFTQVPLPHSAHRRISHKKSVQRTASQLALARMAQHRVHLQEPPTVVAGRFPPGRREEARFFPVSLAAA